MTDPLDPPINEELLLEAARKAVEAGTDVQRAIRDLALEALGQGRLTAERTKAVVRTVAEGAARAAAAGGAELREELLKAMAGLEEALGMTATATRLAIEEAAANLKDFTASDLKRALDDLLALEQLFLDSVAEVGRSTKSRGAGILHDLAEHARKTGTAFGSRTREACEAIRRKLGRSAATGMRAGKETALAVSARLARSASQILSGLADRLEAETRQGSEEGNAPAAGEAADA
ncbi:MAG: hypothetical protein JXQ29_03780 [Planctomycetes bacterium]|nr:hypothetical protein [Planctomycetota bacterium]